MSQAVQLRLLAAAAFLVGCAKAEKAPPVVTLSNSFAPPPANASAAPSASSTPAEIPSYTSSVALFAKDRLVACVDVIESAGLLDEVAKKAGVPAQKLVDDDAHGYFEGADTVVGGVLNKSLGKETAALLKPAGKPTPISKSCGEQFGSNRTIISTCIVGAGDKMRVALGITNFDALANDDRAMRGCLAAKGAWEETPKDSAAYLRAKHEQLYRSLLSQ